MVKRSIEILGTGCPRCQALADNAEAAARQAGVDYEVVRITDVSAILDRDVLMTPGIAIDGRVRLVGRVASVEEIAEWLAEQTD
jgi:small redox-active disulfide protein 2